MLNVGPTGDGIIPAPSVERLAEIGDWMEVNGEAIHGCGPTPFGVELGRTVKDKNGKKKVVDQLPWRSTTRDGRIYIHLLEWPGEELTLPQVESTVTSSFLLGQESSPLTATQTDESTIIKLPESQPKSLVPVICLTIEE